MSKSYNWGDYDPTLTLKEAADLYKAMRKEVLRRFRSAHKGQLALPIFRQTQRYLSKLNESDMKNLNRLRNRIAKFRAFLTSKSPTKRHDFEEFVRKELAQYKELGFIIPAMGQAFEDASLSTALVSIRAYIAMQVRYAGIPSKYRPIAETEVYHNVITTPDEYYQEEWQTIQVAPGVYRKVRKLKNTGKTIYEFIDEAIKNWVEANRPLWEDEYGQQI